VDAGSQTLQPTALLLRESFPEVRKHTDRSSYSVIQGGQLVPSGGTSAASPIVASLIALLNDARLQAGQPTLGFLNPLLYFYLYKGFTDITAGSSNGCNGNNTQTGKVLPGVRHS
jgi:tripeptidyl-peptidase I